MKISVHLKWLRSSRKFNKKSRKNVELLLCKRENNANANFN